MEQELNRFLKTVQSKAYAQAVSAVGNRDEALDIVQDTMFKLAKSYATRHADEWPMLFQRILQNQIRDWYRRQKVRSILFWWDQAPSESSESSANALSEIESPEEMMVSGRRMGGIDVALKKLPLRQQQAFLLRALWGHSVEETAQILGCKAATVKTHYARAIKMLKTSVEVNV